MPTKRQKRLDAIAWMVQEDQTCGSVCFDGEHLVLTTNKHLCSELTSKIKAYLVSTAQRNERYFAPDCSRKERHRLKHKIKNSKKKLREELVNSDLAKLSNHFLEDVLRSISKITSSIRTSYEDPTSDKAFDDEVITAIGRGNVLIYVEKTIPDEDYAVHAELKIIQHLIDENKIDLQKKESTQPEYYIGLSKKCCVNCWAAIEAINRHMGREVIQYRGFQPKSFPCKIPRFLKDNPIRRIFLDVRQVGSLKEAFSASDEVTAAEQYQDRSSSSASCESDKAYNRELMKCRRYRFYKPPYAETPKNYSYGEDYDYKSYN